MLKRLFTALGLFVGFSFAHIKPAPHEHIGFLHVEDLLLAGALIALAGVAVFALSKLKKENP